MLGPMDDEAPPPEPQSTEDWARLIKTNWEKRARSSSRDFYVASHPGWQRSEVWARQAESDVSMILTGLADPWLEGTDLLEVGCGVGRLARPFLARVRSYTGVDVAPGMVEEARSRLADEPRARFFVSDGLGVPDAAKDHDYDLIVALAVFIHCPRDLVERLVADGYARLRPGGRFRFQLLADPTDPTGVEAAPPAAVDERHQEIVEMEEAATEDDRALIDDHYYMGHAFGYDEARARLGRIGGELTLRRFDLAHIYGELLRV